MSLSTPTNERNAPRSGSSLPAAIKAGAFWAAVLLPFCSLALLLGGLDTPTEYVVFVGLVVTNVLALIAGHDYGR